MAKKLHGTLFSYRRISSSPINHDSLRVLPINQKRSSVQSEETDAVTFSDIQNDSSKSRQTMQLLVISRTLSCSRSSEEHGIDLERSPRYIIRSEGFERFIYMGSHSCNPPMKFPVTHGRRGYCSLSIGFLFSASHCKPDVDRLKNRGQTKELVDTTLFVATREC